MQPVPEGAWAGAVQWGEGDHNHPAPEDASGVAIRKQGVRGTTPELVGAAQGLGLRLAQGVRIGLPRAAPQGMGGGNHRFRPKMDLSDLFKLRGGGITPPRPAVREGVGEEAFKWGEGDHNHPMPGQGESVGAAQDLGLRPAPGTRASAQQGGFLTPHQGRATDKPAGLGSEGWRAPV